MSPAQAVLKLAARAPPLAAAVGVSEAVGDSAAGAGSSGAETETLAPSLRREKPVVTTRSPAAMPRPITACISDWWATVTGRRFTRSSAPTT